MKRSTVHHLARMNAPSYFRCWGPRCSLCNAVTMDLAASGKVRFEGREYRENDSSLVEAVKRTGKLAAAKNAHFACAAEAAERWGSAASKGGRPGAAKVASKVSKPAPAIPAVLDDGANIMDTFAGMF